MGENFESVDYADDSKSVEVGPKDEYQAVDRSAGDIQAANDAKAADAELEKSNVWMDSTKFKKFQEGFNNSNDVYKERFKKMFAWIPGFAGGKEDKK